MADSLKQWHADFVEWFRDMELPMSDRAGLLFDRLEAIEQELVNVLPTIKRSYGEPGSRDVDVAAWNNRIDQIVEEVFPRPRCKGDTKPYPCDYCGQGPCPLPI